MSKLYTYKYPHPAVSVDCAIFGWDGSQLNLLLIERGGQPYRGRWAFPGGFVEIDEDLETAARRELEEETCLKLPSLRQFGTFGAPDRDPRERIITVGYFTLVAQASCHTSAASDARKVRWWPALRPPPLAFDHSQVLRQALDAIRDHARLYPIGLAALPPVFTGEELAKFYSAVLRCKISSSKLARKLVAAQLIKPRVVKGPAGTKSGTFFQFNRSVYRKLERKGLGDKGFASKS